MKYPKDSLQYFCNSWWQENSKKETIRGTLIKAYVPHVDQIPSVLIPIGRSEATSHDKVHYEIGPLAIGHNRKRPSLPVAALPSIPGEEKAVYRAKKRPMLIIGESNMIPKELTRGKPNSQTAPTILAAPFYGIKHKEDRAGYNPEFVQRVRRCEYPHFLWDHLPFTNGEESLLRFDHIQPIGDHHQTIEFTGYSLSAEGMVYLNEWIRWYLHKDLNENSMLMQIRNELLRL